MFIFIVWLMKRLYKKRMEMQVLAFPLALLPTVSLFAEERECGAPNIVFILADDMGYGDVGALNEEGKIRTPNLDRMAGQGCVFTDAHSSSSVSTPTRYGLLTGRYNWRSPLKNGVLDGYSKALIPAERTTMASMLKRAGYRTACIGKWHLGWNWSNIENGAEQVDFSKPITGGPVALGFDYFYGFCGSLDMPPYVYVENDRPTTADVRLTQGQGGFGFYRKGMISKDFSIEDCLPNLTRRAVKYIEEQTDGEQPFFLYFPLPAPHTPIVPTKEFQGKSGLNAYGDFVMMVDWVVGEVMRTLERQGICENTILVFATDNGCSPQARLSELQQKGHFPGYIYRGHKADLFEGGHRIPCILQWPVKVKPHRVEQTVCLTDFMATFAAVSGERLADNEGEDSYNLLPALLKRNYRKTIREATVHHSINGSFTIRRGEWKLLLAPGSGGWSAPKPGEDEGLPAVQLYRLGDDPAERNNLYAEYPEVVEELTELMRKYIREGRSTPGVPQQNDGKREWKQILPIMEKRNCGFSVGR